MPPGAGYTKGSKRNSSLLQTQIRKTSETRGFAQSRLLTRWTEIVGGDIAAISRLVEVKYSRGGFGATLTLLTTGANAPMLEMQKEKMREKMNAVYGYNAILRVWVTQTASTGFFGRLGALLSPPRSSTDRKAAPYPARGAGNGGWRSG